MNSKKFNKWVIKVCTSNPSASLLPMNQGDLN